MSTRDQACMCTRVGCKVHHNCADLIRIVAKTPLELVPAVIACGVWTCSTCYVESATEKEAFLHVATVHCGFHANEGCITCPSCGGFMSTGAHVTVEELNAQFLRHFQIHTICARQPDTLNSHDRWICRVCGMNLGASMVDAHVQLHVNCPKGMTSKVVDGIHDMLFAVCDRCGKCTDCVHCAKAHVAREQAKSFAQAMTKTHSLGCAETVQVMSHIIGGSITCPVHGVVPAI